jgi:hypothetical protein
LVRSAPAAFWLCLLSAAVLPLAASAQSDAEPPAPLAQPSAQAVTEPPAPLVQSETEPVTCSADNVTEENIQACTW